MASGLSLCTLPTWLVSLQFNDAVIAKIISVALLFTLGLGLVLPKDDSGEFRHMHNIYKLYIRCDQIIMLLRIFYIWNGGIVKGV